ncbi:hypothetical protein NUACC21_47700 [Scytonema sp. NUACC21]
MNYPTVYTSEQVNPIHLVGKMGRSVQISIHSPSQYICANREQILPDWRNALSLWVVIVLQQTQYEMVDTTPEIEAEKEKLREKFMRFGCDVAFNLRDRGYLTDLIDPRTGYPLLSRPGKKTHDDTAVVKALLHYPVIQNRCRVLVHPTWGAAVYPSVLISEAPPMVIEWAIRSIAPLHDWQQKDVETL